jgi:hypothetical protein
VESSTTVGSAVVDPNMLGTLYMGVLRIDADPYAGFKKNLTNIRCEASTLMHIRNAQAIRFLETLS